MSVCFTNQNIHVQFIDDAAGVTLAAASTRSKSDARPRQAARQRDQRASRSARWPRKRRWPKASRRWFSTAAAARYHWSKGKDGKPVYGKLAAWPTRRAKRTEILTYNREEHCG